MCSIVVCYYNIEQMRCLNIDGKFFTSTYNEYNLKFITRSYQCNLPYKVFNQLFGFKWNTIAYFIFDMPMENMIIPNINIKQDVIAMASIRC